MRRLGIAMLLAAAPGCGESPPPDFKVGGLYSVKEGDDYRVIKVLALDPNRDLVHARLYKNKFPARPQEVDPSKLSLGSIKDKDGYGVGHLPADKSLIREWAPELIMETPVAEEELEGYRLWRESKGGTFK